MYATIQRVRNTDGVTGVNAFLYRHGDQPIPGELDVDAWGESPPGDPVARVVQIPPGGNFVDSFVDIVGPDQEHDALFESVLAAARKVRSTPDSREKSLNITLQVETFSFHFYSSPRVPASAREEFGILSGFLPELLNATDVDRPRLIIKRARRDDVYEYRISEESRQVIADAEFPFEVAPVTIDDDVLNAFERTRGRFEDQLPALFFGTSDELALLFDGATVVSADGRLSHSVSIDED